MAVTNHRKQSIFIDSVGSLENETRVGVTGCKRVTGMYIRSSTPVDTTSLTPWVPVFSMIGMATRQPVHLNGPVDHEALAGSEAAQKVLNSWHRHLRTTPVTSNTITDGVAAEGVGCFFSGGVDSFYSALHHRDRITHLIFVHGFDVRLAQVELADEIRTNLRAAAAELGKPLIEVSTNLLEGSGRLLRWGDEYHGAGMAAVALSLNPMLKEVIIPSSDDESRLQPWGSHPSLDPLWSSRALRLTHDAVDVTRVEKVASVAANPTAMKYLRVCFDNLSGMYNCGRCEKCTRTRITLELVGAGGRCSSLPPDIDLSRVANLKAKRMGEVNFLHENYATLQASPHTNEELGRALLLAVERCHRRLRLVKARKFVLRFIPHSAKPLLRSIRFRLTNK